jgi:(2Fe-2S) ferredoxin
MKKYRVSVCKGPDCKQRGSDAVFRRAQEELVRSGALPRCELYRGGCYGLCHLGPNVVVREDVGRPRDLLSKEDFQLMYWPEETYYWATTPDRVARIMAEHVAADRPIPEFVGDPSQEPAKTET